MKKLVFVVTLVIGVIVVSMYVILEPKHVVVTQQESTTLETTQIVQARDDGIIGSVQPYPFIVEDNAVRDNLAQYAADNEDGAYIYERISQLPRAQQVLLANNKDTTAYVKGYLTGERVPFEEGESVVLNRAFPYYIQWDRRWAYQELGEDTIAIGGCGPTSVVMLLVGLLQDDTITPDKIARLAEETGYYTQDGTSWAFFDFVAEHYQLHIVGVGQTPEAMQAHLRLGHPIIATLKPGRFTTVGHIVLIVGMTDDGRYLVNDPNSYARTLKQWSFAELDEDVTNMWAYSRLDES